MNQHLEKISVTKTPVENITPNLEIRPTTKHSYCDIHRNRPITIINGNENYTIKLISRGSKCTSNTDLCPTKKKKTTNLCRSLRFSLP